MSRFISHFHKNPVASTLEEVETLPIYSIIDADGILYEKSITAVGETSTFVELGDNNSQVYKVSGRTLLESIAAGKVRILRVGN